MFDRVTLMINASGAVNRSGIETPNGTKLHRVLMRDGKRYLVIKLPGHKYWSGRGQQSYAKAELEVYEVLDVLPSNRTVTATRLFSIGLDDDPTVVDRLYAPAFAGGSHD